MMNKIIQDYVLQESIGKGQYGNVYKAEHRKTKQLFAVKVMNVEKFKHTPKLSQFTNNEIAILSKINHINIIKFIEMLRTANNYYLVYQYCNGGTLAEYIKLKGKLPEDEAIKIFAQLRSAFQALNSENILHRDLKPTNILFHSGVIKLADFGFCKQLLKDNDMTQTMVGSPIYMAPQVLKGLIYDSRADIWSLGVILYQMLFGVCPYEESTIPKLVSLIDNTLLKFPPDVAVSENIKMLIKRMLTIKYRQRISPSEFIKYPLDGKAPLSPAVSNSPSTFKEVARFIRKAEFYLAQTLDILSEYVDDPKYLKMCFLVYKILNAVQKDTNKGANYWELLKIHSIDPKWEDAYAAQANSLKPFGEIVKEALLKTDTSFKTKLEFQTNYIDSKYFMEIAVTINDNEHRMRLLNCLLYSKHFVGVMEKKVPDWTDYTLVKKSLQQKEDLCNKFAKYF